jgi:hypothetical protein
VAAFGAALGERLEHLYSDTPLVEPSPAFFNHLAHDLETDASETLGLPLLDRFVSRQMESARERAAFLSRTMLGAELLWVSRTQSQRAAAGGP